MSWKTPHKFTDTRKLEFLFRKHPELIEDMDFVEEVLSFLKAHPEMIDEIEVVAGSEKQKRYFRTKQDNYENPSPAQAEVRAKVGKTAYGHYGERGLRECKTIEMPLVCSHVQEAFKDYEPHPKPRYSKKMRERVLKAKRKPTFEETMKKLREALMQIAEVVEASK
jgi:hypothetical protein